MLKNRLLTSVLAAATIGVVGLLVARQALSSDHADTPEIAGNPGTDITDVFVFPSTTNPNNVVLAMCVHPLIAKGGTADFDPSVLYQFKIDNSGDRVEDLVIQAKFDGSGSNQVAQIAGPVPPSRTGTQSVFITPSGTTGKINTTFSPRPGMTVFTGLREDPFFFDLERFFAIFPDRATPITGTPIAEPNKPLLTSWRDPGVAQDFLKDFNLLAIVVEVPRSELKGAGDGKIGVWCTTSK